MCDNSKAIKYRKMYMTAPPPLKQWVSRKWENISLALIHLDVVYSGLRLKNVCTDYVNI